MSSPVTLLLIAANVIISAIEISLRSRGRYEYFNNFAEFPYEIVYRKKIHQVFTSAFLHADWMHLLFNMFTLFSFGIFLERQFIASLGEVHGTIFYAGLYFFSLIASSTFTVIKNYKNPNYAAVGASGAISGLLFSYIIFYPFRMIGFFFIPMPAILFAVLYIGVSVYGMKKNLGNIGYEAHIGGAVGGVQRSSTLN